MNHAQTLVSATTHAVEPQASPSAAVTSSCVLMVVSWPPRRFGIMSLKSPASRIASMFSSGMRRSASACAALRASSGCSSVALRISSSASTAVSMTDTCSPLLDEVGDLALGADAEERLAVELLVDQRLTMAWRPPVFASRQMRCMGLESAKPDAPWASRMRLIASRTSHRRPARVGPDAGAR